MIIETTYLIKIVAAFTAGGLLGMEREFHSKPAGFRTMILICVGSTLFTMLSISFSPTSDRVASTIVTGIGFLGAGVVFKDGLTVNGITSAATIWMVAAIGMAIGLGFYKLAALVLILVLATLIVLMKLEEIIDNLRQIKTYIISIDRNEHSLEEFEAEMDNMKIYYVRYKLAKHGQIVTAYYRISTKQPLDNQLNTFLLNTKAIVSFEM